MRQFYQWLPVLSVVAIYVLRLTEIGTKRATIPGTVREKWTFRLFLVAGTLVFVGSLAEYVLRGWRISWPMFVCGWVLAILSFSLRRAAIAALGPFWSLHVEIRDTHEFVRHGPFRHVRHPAYFSMVLELLALVLICGATFTCILIPLLFIPVLIRRLRIEESALVEKFGDTYREYQRSTPMLLPWKW